MSDELFHGDKVAVSLNLNTSQLLKLVAADHYPRPDEIDANGVPHWRESVIQANAQSTADFLKAIGPELLKAVIGDGVIYGVSGQPIYVE